jgi:hypothetical protein
MSSQDSGQQDGRLVVVTGRPSAFYGGLRISSPFVGGALGDRFNQNSHRSVLPQRESAPPPQRVQ